MAGKGPGTDAETCVADRASFSLSPPRTPGSRLAAVPRPNCSGVVEGQTRLPEKLSRQQRALEDRPAAGTLFPRRRRDRIFLTAVPRQETVLSHSTARTARLSGRGSAGTALEKVHRIGSPPSPRRRPTASAIVSFFGSCGLFCYSRDGKLLWHRPMGPSRTTSARAAPPILAGRVACSSARTTTRIPS